jgi:predicted nuclease of predicted toxin-antitoxin system
MKFLLDMGVSPRSAEFLRSLGYDAVHLRERGLARLSDQEIVRLADLESRVIVTFDLDFTRILALQRLARPSVVLFRLERFTTDQINRSLGDLIARFKVELETGVIVVVDPSRIRLRKLPVF